jgi:hypothetical protein
LSYSDGDFGTNWSATQLGQTGSVAASRIANGGNPGAYWSVTNNVDTTDISAVSLRSDFTFNPSVSGAIQDLSFSYDAITNISGQGQGTAPALMQNGKLYEVQPENTGYYSSYTSISFAVLHAESFFAFDGSHTHPDFSTAGATIAFGFANSNGGTGIFSHRTTQSHYDNFSVVVNFTPASGDYNRNGVIDAADYTVWRDTLGSTTDLRADGNADGIVNQLDYQIWKDNFPHSGAGSAAIDAVPEPFALGLLAIGIAISGYACRRRR